METKPDEPSVALVQVIFFPSNFKSPFL